MITSTSNQQVKALIQLRKKSRLRSEQDVFLVEGIKMFEEVPNDRLVQTFMSESFYKKYFAEKSHAKDDRIIVLSDSVFEAVSDTQTPQGVLCVVRQYHYEPEQLCGERPLLMVLEHLQDPGNLGTIVRTAEGAGVTGILMSSDTVDIYNPKVIRSTMGSIYRMPFYYTDDLTGMIGHFRNQGIVFHAAHLAGSVSYETCDYRGPSGFLIGNESKGLTDAAADAADIRIRIPMCGKVESLNAGIASAVLMYEAHRQRNTGMER